VTFCPGIFVVLLNENKMHYLYRLQETIRSNWDKPALCNYGGESFSFGELAEDIEKFHILFEYAGLKKGEHIALCARNSARWAISFLAVNTFGAVVVPILSDFHPDSVNSLVDHSESTVLFTDTDIWSRLDIRKMPAVRLVIAVNTFEILYCADASLSVTFKRIPEIFQSRYPMGFSGNNLNFPVEDNDTDVAVINYTSGTTSSPKGVMLRYECFSTMIDFSISRIKVSCADSIVSMLPMGHIYGLVFEFLYPLCFGCSVHYLGRTPSPTFLLKAMRDIRPFMVVCVPLVMEKIYKNSIKPVIAKWYMQIVLHIPGLSRAIYRKFGRKLQEAFGGKVRNFIMGGASLSPEVEKCFRRIRLPYTVGYGMTEAAPLLTYEDWFNFVPGSCGKAVPCCDIRIDSDDPHHIAGEIQARGKNICSGYFKNDEASGSAFTSDGYLRTGDLGIMGKNGDIFIKGRSKNMILSANGQNIYPEELEAVINAQPYVGESVVVDRNGRLVALVFLDRELISKDRLDDERVSDIPENVRSAANRLLPGYSQINKVEIVMAPFEKTPKLSIKRFLYK